MVAEITTLTNHQLRISPIEREVGFALGRPIKRGFAHDPLENLRKRQQMGTDDRARGWTDRLALMY